MTFAKNDTFKHLLAFLRRLRRPIASSAAHGRIPDVPDYLRRDIGLPEAYRPKRAHDPPRTDPLRFR